MSNTIAQATSSTTQTQLEIELNGKVQTGTMISLNFNALQGANPKALGYFVAIWQGNQIMSYKEALHTQLITTSDRAGSVTFENLSIANLDYIIGFGVNNEDGTTICATMMVPKGSPQFSELPEAQLSSVTLQYQSSDSLITSFVTPAYNLAKTNQNWIALFKGGFTANMYKGANVICTAMVEDNSNTGAVAMNNIPGGGMVRFQEYTIVYGMGTDASGNPNYSNLISATQFKVP